jgi:murein DD-endopeptidase MepM/ murein hydrolase activator NlpD
MMAVRASFLIGSAGLLLLAGCQSYGGWPRRAPPAKTHSAAVPPPAAQTTRPTPAPAPARPAWVARRVVPDAIATPQGRIHTVKPGETGIAIARAYGVPWPDVVALNSLAPPYVLEVGQKLRLPSAQAATARVAGMTLEQRAQAFDLDIDSIVTGGEPAARPAARPAAKAAAPLPALTGPAPAFRWPVEGRIVSGFGPKPGGRFNDGVNLKVSAGQPVRAAGDGVVAYAGDAIPGFGNLLLIKHADGWVSAYGHNEALLVKRGTRVKAGEVIARAGQSGAVSEPQLHFELRKGRQPVDPARVIGGR